VWFLVELWDDQAARVERVLATTRTAFIGYSVHFAAAKEHPGRLITLRLRGRILSRWSQPS
jgi:hypothetical protein